MSTELARIKRFVTRLPKRQFNRICNSIAPMGYGFDHSCLRQFDVLTDEMRIHFYEQMILKWDRLRKVHGGGVENPIIFVAELTFAVPGHKWCPEYIPSPEMQILIDEINAVHDEVERMEDELIDKIFNS